MEMDPVNISIGHSDVSLSGIAMELGLVDDKAKPVELKGDIRPSTPPTESDSSYTSLSTNHDSPSSTENFLPPAGPAVESAPRVPSPTQVSSPLRREGDLGGSLGSINGRMPRISREDVQRRLRRQRSTESPASEAEADEVGDEKDEAKKRMSVLTDFDMSTETATIETVTEKRNVGLSNITTSVDPPPQPMAQTIDLPQTVGESLMLDMGQFGMGAVDVDMKSALDRLMDDVAESATADNAGTFERNDRIGAMKVEAVTEGVQAGRFEMDESMRTETEEDESQDLGIGKGRPPLTRAATEPELFSGSGPMSPSGNRTASGSTIPPPPPPKDAIRSREELIIEKRREARRREEEEDGEYWTPPRPSEKALAVGKGRPSRRRSRSTGDMEELARKSEKNRNGMSFLDVGGLERHPEDDLSDSIQRELRKLGGGRSVSRAFKGNYVY